MAFLKVGNVPKKKQRLYLMEITLPSGFTVIKLGKASGPSSKERMLQICSSIYDKFRRTPMVYIKRDREVATEDVFKLETILHRFFADYKYETKHKFDGVTECFTIPLEDAQVTFDLVVEGLVPEHTYVLPEPIAEDSLTF